MPADLDFKMYFDIAFFSVLVLGMLFGFLRGMKKALYSLIVTVIYIAVFFLTLEAAVNFIYNVQLPFLGGVLGGIFPGVGSVTTLSDAIPAILESMIGEDFSAALSNEHLLAFISSLALFVMKIVWAILYFTVLNLIYRFITFLIRVIFFRSRNKDKRRSKHRLFGGLFGLMSGAVSVFMMLIILGGVMNITESISVLGNGLNNEETLSLEFEPRDIRYQSKYSVLEMAETPGIPSEFGEVLDLIDSMVTAYNENIIVQASALATIPVGTEGDTEVLNLYLFDQVMSMNFEDEQIAIRNELAVFASAANQVLNSEFMNSNDIGDLTGQEIRNAFNTLSESNLLTSLIPLGIEVAADMYEEDITIDIDLEDLYEIEWDAEIMQLGEIAASIFDIVEASQILDEEADLTEVTIDGDLVSDLFDEIGESDLVNLAAYVAIEPILEMAGETAQAVITVPADIVWADEFAAIGTMAGEFFNTGVTIGDLESGDPMVLLTTMADMNFTVILNSRIVTNALINILSGEADLGIDLSVISIPANIVWLDELDGDGNIIANGELRNILLAINALASQVENLDFENFQISSIAELDVDAINTIFESRILVATITDLIKDLDFGDFNVVIPDSVFDEDGYILKLELQNVVDAVHMATTELACDPDDTECESLGFDFTKALTLDEDNIDILLESEILSATVGKMLIDMGGDVLVVPSTATADVLVDEVAVNVVSKAEIKSAFLAVTALGITDINDIEVDASILTNLATEDDSTVLDTTKTGKIFSSEILHATISDLLLDMTSGDNPVMVVPYTGFDDSEIRYIDTDSGVEYVAQAELESVLAAVLVLDLSDFNNVDSLDLSLIIDNSTTILDSAILHATISDQLFDLGSDVITIPYVSEDETSIRVTKGETGKETIYLAKSELEAIFDALEIIGITDINTFDGTIDLEAILADDENVTTLLNSAVIHATVSEQMINLADDGTINIPYVASDNVTEIRKTVGIAPNETTYIAKAEIEAMFDALDVIGITDIESFNGTVDLEAILADDGNVTILLSSAVIHATVSDQMINLADDGTINIPYFAEDNTTEIRKTVGTAPNETIYIAKAEIEAMFDALDVIGITDIETFDGNIDLAEILADENNVTILLQSSVIQATVSDQLLDLDTDGMITVPYLAEDNTTEIRKTVGSGETETVYIIKDEIDAMFKALNALGITDVNAFDGNVNLGLLADDTNRAKVLASSTIQATITDQLIKLDDTDGLLEVPYLAFDGTTEIRKTVGSGETEFTYVVVSELDKIFVALNILGILDVQTFTGDVDLSVLAVDDNAETVLLSDVIQATVSKQVLDLNTDGTIVVPYYAEDDDTLIRKTVGSLETETNYISKTELESMIMALDVLNLTDVTTFTGTVDLTLLADAENRNTVLASSTIQATITDQLIKLDDTDGLLEVPYLADDGTTEIRKTVASGTPEEFTYIITSELDRIFVALDILNIGDVESFDGDVDLSILGEGDNAEIVLLSDVIQATVSKQVLDLHDADTIEVPYLAVDNNTEIRKPVGTGVTETVYITKLELEKLILALDVLNLTDVNTFTGGVDLTLLNDPANRATVLASSTIQATITKQILDLDALETLEAPFLSEDNSTEVRKTVGVGETEIEYIVVSELDKIFVALNVLGITDVNNFTGAVDLGILAVDNNAQLVVASDIIQATVSKQVLDLGTSVVTVPYLAVDDSTEIRKLVGSGATETDYIVKDELEKLILALDVLELTDVNTFTGGVDLTLLNDPTNRATVLASSTIQATITKQILDLDASETLEAPYLSDDNTTLIRRTVGSGLTENEYIIVSELNKIFDALSILGIDDVTDFEGDVDLSVLGEGNNAETVFLSDIIQATVSKQVLDLGPAIVTVPYYAVDDVTKIRKTVGELTTETEYIAKEELKKLVLALDVLSITDVNAFGGTVNLSLLNDNTNRATVLASSTIQATITKQILDLEVADTLEAPHYSEDNTTLIRKVVGAGAEENEYIIVTELDKVFIALNILGISDVSSFDGDVDLSILATGNNAETVLASDVIQATVSKQVLDLDVALTIKVPHLKDDDTTVVRRTVGALATEFEYVTKQELEDLIVALNILSITDVTTFDGQIDLTLFYEVENRNTLLTSSIMQATISKQVFDLGSSVMTVPTTDVNDTEIRRTVGAGATLSEYILKSEIHAIFEAMELLNITNINSFTGTVSLNKFFESQDVEYDANQDILLASASMHATITKQIDDLGVSVMEIPSHSVLGSVVDLTVSTNYFITKGEIKALINALDILQIGDITSFTGTVNLTPLFESPTNPDYLANQNTLLASSLMHKTITNQITNLGPSVLLVPSIGFDGVTTLDLTVETNYYIETFEIRALIDALGVFGINDITSFDGTIDISSLALEADQNKVLSSESMHATISKTLFDLDDQVLIVPIYTSAGEIEANRVQKQVNTIDFIYKGEIKALINAFIGMGYSDLNNFGSEINSQKFFDDPDLYLLSASIHATLSDKMINGTGGNLVVPDTNYTTLAAIRLIHSDVVYVEMNETKALLTALEEIGLTDFSAISINPTNLFDDNTDLDVLLASASMQATISDTLLDGAGDDSTGYGTGTLIVPDYYREGIKVNTVDTEQIEKVELKNLINGLKTVGVGDFSGAVPSSSVTSLSSGNLDIILTSGSMHVTIDHMIWGNTNVNAKIPDFEEDLALNDGVYGMNNIIIKAEIKAFIIAAQQFAGADLTSVSFDIAGVIGLSEAQRDLVLDSMIVRNILTDEIEATPFYTPNPSNYEQGNTSYFLTEAGIKAILGI